MTSVNASEYNENPSTCARHETGTHTEREQQRERAYIVCVQLAELHVYSSS